MIKNLFSLLFIVLFCSCGNNPDPTPNSDPRLPFVGTYNMTKLENGATYTMSIDTVGDHCDCNNCDSMDIINFADLFNLRFNYQCYIPSYQLVVPFFNPAIDKYGHKWHLTWGYNGPDAPTHYNAIYGDSIKISFRIDNILYYAADGVPYLDTIYTHVGIRQ
jgi:hypothetical protein